MIRSPSAWSSMSSQTHPQKVHVPFFTTVTLMSVPPPALPPARSRAARRTFSRAPGPGSSRAFDGCDSVRSRRAPTPGRAPARGWSAADTPPTVGRLAAGPSLASPLPLHTLGVDRLHLDFPALRRGHPGSVGASAHQPARRRTVRDEDHARRNLSLAALERGLAML